MSLPLWPGAAPCVNSGYCCKQAPCPFGEWNESKSQCAHLTDKNLCGIYDEIIKQPGWEFAPAFGAGCCSSLNSDRQRIIADLESGIVSPEEFNERDAIRRFLESRAELRQKTSS